MGVVRNFPRGGGGVVLNVTFQKCSVCTDLFNNTLYRNCITFPPPPQEKRGGGLSSDHPDPPLPPPLLSEKNIYNIEMIV